MELSSDVQLALRVSSLILAVVSLVVILLTFKKSTRPVTALKVFLAFLLVCVNIPLLNWLLIALWGVVGILNLFSLSQD